MENGGEEPVRVPVEFFFDYNCPFCYVGSERLDRVAARYPVAIHYRFIEIHPGNPATGQPVAALGYPPAQRQRMDEALDAMVRQDRLPFAERRITTNSRRALLLAQAVLDERPQCFRAFHRGLFRRYFADGTNIGDPEVLQGLAREHGVDDLAERAWETPHYLERLLEHVEAARSRGLTGVPTLVVGDRPFAGAVSVATLEQALARQPDRDTALPGGED